MCNVRLGKITDYVRNRNEYVKCETYRIRIPKSVFFHT